MAHELPLGKSQWENACTVPSAGSGKSKCSANISFLPLTDSPRGELTALELDLCLLLGSLEADLERRMTWRWFIWDESQETLAGVVEAGQGRGRSKYGFHFGGNPSLSMTPWGEMKHRWTSDYVLPCGKAACVSDSCTSVGGIELPSHCQLFKPLAQLL